MILRTPLLLCFALATVQGKSEPEAEVKHSEKPAIDKINEMGLLLGSSGSATGLSERQDGVSKLEPSENKDLNSEASFWGHRPLYYPHPYIRPRYYGHYGYPLLPYAHPYGYAGGYGHLGYGHLGHFAHLGLAPYIG